MFAAGLLKYRSLTPSNRVVSISNLFKEQLPGHTLNWLENPQQERRFL